MKNLHKNIIAHYIYFVMLLVIFSIAFRYWRNAAITLELLQLFSLAVLAVGVYANFRALGDHEIQQLSDRIFLIFVSIAFKAGFCFIVALWIFNDYVIAMLAILISQIDPVYVASSSNKNVRSHSESIAHQIIKSWSAFDAVIVITAVMLFNSLVFKEDLNLDYQLGISIFYVAAFLVVVLTYRSMKSNFSLNLDYSIHFGLVSIVLSVLSSSVLPAAAAGAYIRKNRIGMEVLSLSVILLLFSALLAGQYSAFSDSPPTMYSLYVGTILGVIVFASQVVCSFVFWNNLTIHDRIVMAFSQQGGLTTVSALVVSSFVFLEYVYAALIALVVMNTFFVISSIIIDRYIINLQKP